jgi:hypothetical protein
MIKLIAICDKCGKEYDRITAHGGYDYPRFTIVDGLHLCLVCSDKYWELKNEMMIEFDRKWKEAGEKE